MAFELATDAPYTAVLTDNVRILAIDDDPIQLEFADVYLSTPSVRVETSQSGAAGLLKLAGGAYDILLVDLDMPEMNGIEVIHAVRRNPAFRELPIIVITGREDIVSIDAAYAAGATSFVTKPVNWRLLSYHVRFVLRANGRRSNS